MNTTHLGEVVIKNKSSQYNILVSGSEKYLDTSSCGRWELFEVIKKNPLTPFKILKFT